MAATVDDGIEILSCHYETDNDVSLYFSMAKDEDTKKALDDDKNSPTRKKIARAVVVVSVVMLLMSVLLVGISLNMSKNIDDMVRNSNEMLLNQYKTQRPVSEGTGKVDATNSTIK